MKTIYTILIFCLGLFLGHLFSPSVKEISPPTFVQLEKVKQKYTHIDSAYSAGQTIYQKRNDSLVKELKGYQFLLSNARKELSLKREKTFDFVSRIKKDTLFSPDTLLVDSLQQQIISQNLTTDTIISHYQQQDSLLQKMVAIRDTQIVLCNTSFDQLKNLSQDQMQREQQLTDDLNTALKQQKKKRQQNKILSAGMVFVSGIATTLFVKSRH